MISAILPGHHGDTFWDSGERVLHLLLHTTGGVDGHAGLDQLHGQLHPLLRHVQAVQDHIQKDFWDQEACCVPEKYQFHGLQGLCGKHDDREIYFGKNFKNLKYQSMNVYLTLEGGSEGLTPTA